VIRDEVARQSTAPTGMVETAVMVAMPVTSLRQPENPIITLTRQFDPETRLTAGAAIETAAALICHRPTQQ
jgi:hypothetical protein